LIIFDNGNFWIEQHIGEVINLADVTGINVDLTLDKPGTIVSAMIAPSIGNLVSGWSYFLTQQASNTRFSSLPIQNQSGIRVRIRNDSGGAITINVIVTIFLRK